MTKNLIFVVTVTNSLLFILEFKSTFVPNLNKFHTDVPEILRSQKQDGQTDASGHCCHRGIKSKSTYYAPDDERYFKFMREAEDGETKEGKHTRLWGET